MKNENLAKLTKEYVENAYYVEKKSFSLIAKELGVGSTTVKRFAKEQNIQSRHKTKNILNLKFNNLTVIKFIEKKGRHYYWQCICDCGLKTKPLLTSRIITGKVKSCGCLVKRNYYEDMPGYIYENIKKRAEKKKWNFDLTKKYLWDLYVNQNKKCYFSGQDIYFDKSKGTASLDRLDSSKGYTIENVAWVHKNVNFMKLTFCPEDFISICHMVSKTHKETNSNYVIPSNHLHYSD